MDVLKTALAGVLILTPRRLADARGYFSEVWNAQVLAEAGINSEFVQDNHSFSAARGTIRGLHYQAPPHAQAKLVRCGAGAVWDVAVDARRGSPTFGRWVGAELSAENGRQLYIPQGFLHGFATLTDNAELLYKCTDYYAPASDGTVLWSSRTLGIDWPRRAPPQLSDKDAGAPDFDDWASPFDWHG